MKKQDKQSRRRPYETPEVKSQGAFERLALACAMPPPGPNVNPFSCQGQKPQS